MRAAYAAAHRGAVAWAVSSASTAAAAAAAAVAPATVGSLFALPRLGSCAGVVVVPRRAYRAAGDGSDSDGGSDGEAVRGARVGERSGRPFLDPKAPRRQESIRADPIHKDWGGLLDVLEHNAYCDGQREEDPDGFFFDGTKAEYDSDCEGDPFSNGYLTEDELEFSAEYEPAPYLPGRVVDQIYFLYSVRGYSVKALCTKYRLSSEKVSAIINLKHSEPDMIASGRYTTKVDKVMQQLYEDKFKDAEGGSPFENWGPDFDQGVNYTIMRDDQMPDDVTPVRRVVGNVLRIGHHLPRLPRPAKADRVHDSKFVFRSISGRRANSMRTNPLVTSDFNGELRPASNLEALYRSWETRHWAATDIKGRSGLPFADADAHKPARFRLAP